MQPVVRSVGATPKAPRATSATPRRDSARADLESEARAATHACPITLASAGVAVRVSTTIKFLCAQFIDQVLSLDAAESNY